MGFETLAVVIVYLVVVTGVGVALSRRAQSGKDWAVAGGGMGAAMVAVGIAGTRIGGAGTYGVAERTMSGGLWYMWWYSINTFLAIAIVAFFFARAYRRLGLATVGAIFFERFGTRRCQWITSLCVQTEYLIVDIIEAYLIGAILAQLTGIPMVIGVFIGALILISYVSMSGLWGSAFTNLIHCGVILVGLAAVGLMGMQEAGGFGAVTAAVDGHLAGAERDTAGFWSFAGAGWGAVIGMFFSAAIHTPAASVYTNFATAARDERQLIPALLCGGAIASLMPILAGFVGIVTLARYGVDAGLGGYRNLTQLAMDLSPLVGGVALAAILAAVISSGAPILLASATMFVNDWLHAKERTSQQTLRTYRVATILYGLVAALAAYFVSMTKVSLLDLLLFGFAMVVPPAIAIGYLLYWRRTTEAGAYWGIVGGYAAGLAWFVMIKLCVGFGLTVDAESGFLTQLAHALFVADGRGIDPSYATTFVPLLVTPLVSLRTAPASDERAEAFYARVAGQSSQAVPVESAPGLARSGPNG